MIVVKNHEEAGVLVANIIADVVRDRKNACLGLATGGSMECVYASLAELFARGEICFEAVATVNLDEYVGLPPSHPQSYRRYMDRHFFDRVDIDKSHTYIPLGMEPPERMLSDFQNFLDARPRDFQLLGVGANGHIGFNEPGPVFESRAHIVTLNERTRRDNARFFASIDEVPRRAVTMGIGDIMKASRIVTLVHGENKLQAVRELFTHDRVSPEAPCTVLKLHRDAAVVLPEYLARLAGV
ncbi:MAG: glucosamine-6-phosphate deaminase [Synergistaceae bacterium]|jgi:glucosamine-6-phosphate deaminase|nr:glucosamine-6-phosphate deaminase [Synergistaceae bacterium]